jgi:hypothetical protein
MSTAHDLANRRDRSARWTEGRRAKHGALVPCPQFTVFALAAILAGIVLAALI